MSKKSAVKRRSNGQFVKGNKEGQKFEPNNNANPKGRLGALSDIINDVFKEVEQDGKSKKEKMIRKAYDMAVRGNICPLYTSDAADDQRCVELGGRRISKKKKHTKQKHITIKQTNKR